MLCISKTKKIIVHSIAEETLLTIFALVARSEPPFRPTVVTTKSAALRLAQVCHRWREVTFMCRPLWNNIVVHLEGTDDWVPEGHRLKTARLGEHSLNLLQHALEHCGPSVSLHLMADQGFQDTPMEVVVRDWIRNNPSHIRLLEIVGTGGPMVFDSIVRGLDHKQLTSLRYLCLEFGVHDVEASTPIEVLGKLLPLLQSPSLLRKVVLGLHTMSSASANMAMELIDGTAPRFIGTSSPLISTELLSNLRSLRIVDMPPLLLCLQGARLTALDVTCNSAFLSDETLLGALADVITSSAATLRRLRLDGWFDWADERLLAGIDSTTVLRIFCMDFALTEQMAAEAQYEESVRSYIASLERCWSVACQKRTLRSLNAQCTVHTTGNPSVEGIDLTHIFDSLDRIVTNNKVKCVVSYGSRGTV